MKPLKRLILSFLVVLLFAAPTVAQEALWKDLISKAGILYQRGQYSEAAKMVEEALKVAEKTYGPNHPYVGTSLNALALLYQTQGKYAEAEPRYKRSLPILEKALEPDHPDVATVCENMAKCYRKVGKDKEAEELEVRARKIRSGR